MTFHQTTNLEGWIAAGTSFKKPENLSYERAPLCPAVQTNNALIGTTSSTALGSTYKNKERQRER